MGEHALSDLALLPVMLPLAGAALALAAKAVRRGSGILEAAGAFVGLALPFPLLFVLLAEVRSGAVLFHVGGRGAAIGIAQAFDGLAWLLDLLIFAVSAAAWLYARGAGPRGPAFTAVFLIQTASLAAAASCADVFNLFVCLEVMGIASYVLIAFEGKPKALWASFKYLAVSSAAMGFFLAGTYGLYRLTGSLSYEGIARGVAAAGEAGRPLAAASLAAIATAVAVRTAVLPVQGWLPDAHAAAPHAVSAVLSGVLLKVPLFAFGRLLWAAGDPGSIAAKAAAAGAATALVGVVGALLQKDAKRLLAWHSVSQAGYVVAAWSAASEAGLAAAWLYAFYHALFKGTLFLSVGTATDALGTRDVHAGRGALAALRGAGDRGGATFAAFAAGALAIIAAPPFNGYAGKAAVAGLFQGDWKDWALAAAAVGTAASFLKLSRIFLSAGKTRAVGGPGTPAEPVSPTPLKAGYRFRPASAIPMLALAAACLGTGLAAEGLGALAAELLDCANPVPAGLFQAKALAKAGATIALGFPVAAAALSRPWKAAAALLAEKEGGFALLAAAACAAAALLAF